MSLVEMDPPEIAEPDWRKLLSRRADREAASQHWRMITREMRGRDILAPVNLHAVQRLVLATLMHDRAAAKAMRGGPVNEPKRDNPRAIARPSLYFAAMREAGAMAAQLEADLGLSPRTRNKVAKIPRPPRAAPSSRYLKSVPRLPPPGEPLPTPAAIPTEEKEPTR